MSSNFFIRKSKVGVKRKNSGKPRPNSKFKQPKNVVNAKVEDSDEISSGEESVKRHSEDDSDENNLITAQEKKVLLAKKYLEEIEKEEKERLESDVVLQSSVIGRLREDLLNQAGKLSKKSADFILKPDEKDVLLLRCKDQKLSITCVALSPDNKYFFSGSKDAVIVKWSVESKHKEGVILSKHKEKDEKLKEYSHNSTILSLAVSFESKYLASCDESSVIQIRCVSSLKHIHSFRGHRNTVTSLAFCNESNNLYSCSKDRSVRIWNLDEMSFVEALFGHQIGATDVDVLKKDKAVTSGGCDNTLRVWKVQEESQLIFNGHQKSIDRVKRLDQQHFVSCGDDGQICVWGVLKKKPLSFIQQAHGIDETNKEPNWVTSVTCLPNSDLIVSGSCDGFLKFWKCEENFRSVSLLFSISVAGFVNDMAFSRDENFLVLAIGQEHRLGRWFTDKKARNCIKVIPISKIQQQTSRQAIVKSRER